MTLDADSTVNGDVYQDGEKIDLAAGTYENVVVVPQGADYASAVEGGVSAIQEAAASGVVPMDRSDLVAGAGSASDEASEEASGETSGEASADASGEVSGEASGETSGEASGDASGEASGDASGEASGDASGEAS